MDKFEISRIIGTGGFSKVYRAKFGNEEYAVKVIGLDDRWGAPWCVETEKSAMVKLDHENIVRLYEVVTDQKNAYFVLELLDCDLTHYLKRNRNIDPGLIKDFLRQLLRGIEHCHSHDVLHLDLKPSNVLLDKSKNILKLCDFGLSKIVSPAPNSPQRHVETKCYRAPEFLVDTTLYSSAADMWSVGCIFAEMHLGKPMFTDTLHRSVLQTIFCTLGNPDPRVWPESLRLYRNNNCLSAMDPPNLADMFPRLEPAGFDLLTKMLCLNPTERITASESLQHAYFTENH